MDNILYYGDNLDVVRRHIKDGTIDLIYLDPPFNSNANYNVLFSEQNGTRSAAQLQAFKDTWSWAEAAPMFQELTLLQGPLGDAVRAFGQLLKKGGLLAYLVMMAPRLAELHRVLKPTGSIYLHCDPTASHYLKVLMDAIFEPQNLKNEIIWKRTTTKSDYKQGATNWPRVHDVILYYQKDSTVRGNFSQPFAEYSEEYLETFYRYRDPDGRAYTLDNLAAPGAGTRGHPQYEFMGVTRYWRYNKEKMEGLLTQGRVVQTKPGAVPRYKRYLDEMPGVAIGDIWTDISLIQAHSKERLGYQTQKPEGLLERIIKANSKEGDVVLDPFCGCGTAVAMSQKLNRRWIGIDITQAAIQTIKKRLADSFGSEVNYKVIGEPTTVQDAQQLADDDPYQFQWWATGLVGARPTEEKKGADKGIDGRLYFRDDSNGNVKQVILSVKAGHTNVSHVRDLRGVLDREKAEIGVLIIMQEPTDPMRIDAASTGFYQSPWGKHPRLQILTIAELLGGKKIDYPPAQGVNVTFEKAPKAKKQIGRQKQFERE